MDWIAELHGLIGQEGSVNWWQMTVRGVVVFVAGLVLMRFLGQRAFGRQTVMDVILAIVVGSNLSRAITGNAPLWATLVATAALVVIYSALNHLAARSPATGWLVKGGVIQLIRDGRMDDRAMRWAGISEGDILEAMRRSGIARLSEVTSAYLERNGKISVQRE